MTIGWGISGRDSAVGPGFGGGEPILAKARLTCKPGTGRGGRRRGARPLVLVPQVGEELGDGLGR